MRKARDQGGAVAALPLVQVTVVDDARNDLAHVEGPPRVRRHDTVEFLGREPRLERRAAPYFGRRAQVQARHDAARDAERVRVVLRQMIGDTGEPRVYVTAAQVFHADLLSGRGFDQGGTTKEYCSLVAHDDGLVAHGRHVRTPGRAA